jgi:hypothetical protein
MSHPSSGLVGRCCELRATFVTMVLAAGRNETWVLDRTGHSSSDQIHTYRGRLALMPSASSEASRLCTKPSPSFVPAAPDAALFVPGIPTA